MITKASPILKSLLIELKAVKYLSLTNIVKFVKKLLDPKIKAKLVEEVEDMNQLKDKDKLEYIDRIRVVVCNEKCPCCGRVCGLENEHKHHQCIYGHQMRGLNGTHIKVGNGVKEASVIRCEAMGETDEM